MLKLLIGKKYYLISIYLCIQTISFIFTYPVNLAAQSWMPMMNGMDEEVRCLYTDTFSNTLYAGGNFKVAGGYSSRGIASWNGSSWDSLGSGMDDFNSSFPNPVFSIQSYKNKLYVGGSFTTAGGLFSPNLAIWENGNWLSPPFIVNSSVFKIGILNNYLYLGGTFTRVNNLYSPLFVSYNDSALFPMSLGLDSSFGGGSCMELYNLNLFAGGNLLYGSGRDLIVWDSVSSFPLANGILGGQSFITSLAIYKNELYIGGSFWAADGNAGDNLMKWDGVHLSDVGGGLDWTVRDIKVYKNYLYVSGDFDYAGGNPASKIAKWDGTSWSNINNEVFSNNISAMEIYNGHLVVGGGFTSVGTTTVNNIAIFSEALDVINNEHKNTIKIFPNPLAGILHVQSENTEMENIHIYNIYNQEIISSLVNSKAYYKDICDLSPGIYIVEIDTKDGKLVTKIFKK